MLVVESTLTLEKPSSSPSQERAVDPEDSDVGDGDEKEDERIDDEDGEESKSGDMY